jgi:hypothetical protein
MSGKDNAENKKTTNSLENCLSLCGSGNLHPIKIVWVGTYIRSIGYFERA